MLLIHRLLRYRTFETAGKYHIYRKSPKFSKLNTCGSQPICLLNKQLCLVYLMHNCSLAAKFIGGKLSHDLTETNILKL